jgi:uncharacterized membrane protein YfcA
MHALCPACPSRPTNSMIANALPTQVAAASSATMIFFTAAASFVVYLSFGLYSWDYAVPLMVIGFLATLAGQLATSWLVRVVGRRSLIIFVMTALLVIASAVMVYQSGSQVASVARQAAEAAKLTGFGSIC